VNFVAAYFCSGTQAQASDSDGLFAILKLGHDFEEAQAGGRGRRGFDVVVSGNMSSEHLEPAADANHGHVVCSKRTHICFEA
jgi:hypothetical protein